MYLQVLSDSYMHMCALIRVCGLKAVNKEAKYCHQIRCERWGQVAIVHGTLWTILNGQWVTIFAMPDSDQHCSCVAVYSYTGDEAVLRNYHCSLNAAPCSFLEVLLTVAPRPSGRAPKNVFGEWQHPSSHKLRNWEPITGPTGLKL